MFGSSKRVVSFKISLKLRRQTEEFHTCSVPKLFKTVNQRLDYTILDLGDPAPPRHLNMFIGWYFWTRVSKRHVNIVGVSENSVSSSSFSLVRRRLKRTPRTRLFKLLALPRLNQTVNTRISEPRCISSL